MWIAFAFSLLPSAVILLVALYLKHRRHEFSHVEHVTDLHSDSSSGEASHAAIAAQHLGRGLGAR